MNSRIRNFGPMSERTVENALIRLLSSRYDLSCDSVLAREIVHRVTKILEEDEKKRGIKRVYPGELYLKTSHGDIILPIRTQEAINRALSGEKLEDIRATIHANCFKQFSSLFAVPGSCGEYGEHGEGKSKRESESESGECDKDKDKDKDKNKSGECSESGVSELERIWRALSISRGFYKIKKMGHGINTIPLRAKRYGPKNPVNTILMEELLTEVESGRRSLSTLAGQEICNFNGNGNGDGNGDGDGDLFYSGEALEEIIDFLGNEACIPIALREPMFWELARLRARFCPLASTLRSGQMPLVSMHVKAGRRLDLPTRLQPFAPVIITMITPGELETLGRKSRFEYSELMELHARRMARVLIEAYQQDGLISYSELQWCFLSSANHIGRILGWYEHKHSVMLPCPGSVLDMGRMLTHKEIIVSLYLRGLTVLEISKQTYHAPRSVDAYLRVFDSVLILHLYGLPLKLMAQVLNRGESLIEEYLQLIKDNLKEVGELRKYLRSRKIKLLEEVIAC